MAILGRTEGGANVDFGALGPPGSWDAEVLEAGEASRLVAILSACWRHFDFVASSAPPLLRKAPRGGSRDSAGIVEHVRDAERIYALRSGERNV